MRVELERLLALLRFVGAVTGLLCTLEGVASALPAFARRYHAACSTCHAGFPKLNQFGEAFRRNGYQLPDGGDEEGIKQQPIALVPEERAALLPYSDLPSDLAPSVPVAVVLKGLVPIFPDEKTRPVGEKALTFDRMFASASLYLGARAYKDIAVFAGLSLETGTGVELERGFVVISNLVSKNRLGLRVGQFEPQIFGFSDYRQNAGPTRWILEAPPRYGSFTLEPIVRGVNFSGILAGRVGWDAAWAQGVEGGYGAESLRQAPRDGYAHVYAKVGGLRLDGIELPEVRADDRWVQGGVFGYGGRHDVDGDNAPSTPPEADVVYKVGFDLDAHVDWLDVIVAGAVERHDLSLSGVFARVQALAEVTARPFPWLVVAVRGEGEADEGAAPKRRVTPIVCFYPRINMKAQAYLQITDDGVIPGGFRAAEIDLAVSAGF